MKLHIIETEYFKLDGGAMFGVVPHQMWKKINPPDENNMCTWALRCLLIEDGDQKILIDTGMGSKQGEKFRGHFEPHGGTTIIPAIEKAGFQVEDITDVILTHLHFDHVGGAVTLNGNGKAIPSFPNAKYWSNKTHYDWAMHPNPREKASFLKENFVPLEEAGILHFLDEKEGVAFNDNIKMRFAYGHTEAMILPEINLGNGKTLIYTADLLPSAGHVRMPYVMSYDIRPLITLKEKQAFYDDILDKETYVFFEHDKDNVLGKLKRNERGRYEMDVWGSLEILDLRY